MRPIIRKITDTKQSSIGKLLASLTFMLVVLASNLVAQSTIYVDINATGNGNGSSWQHAFVHLNDAISAATGANQIWVAEGTYYPDLANGVNSNDRNARFTLTGAKNGIRIIGGFSSGDTFADRDPINKQTILSGDINQSGTSDGNSYSVVYVDASSGAITNATRLDGFTITGGNANVGATNSGGGLRCIGNTTNECSPTLANMRFLNNSSASLGGAIHGTGAGDKGRIIVINSFFTGNVSGQGAAIYSSGNIRIVNSVFAENSALGFAGAIYFVPGTTSASIVNSTIVNNSAGQIGGAVFLNSATLSISNTIIWNNTGPVGDRIALAGGATLQINHSVLDGGLSAIRELSPSTVTDGGGLLVSNPLLNADFIPTAESNVLNAGLNSSVPLDFADVNYNGNVTEQLPADIIGDVRISNGTVSIGAYENIFSGTVLIYVDVSAEGLNDGLTWSSAFTDLNSALTVATGNDEIYIAAGTYKPGTARANSFTITGEMDGVRIYGGFPAGGGTPAERNPSVHRTILDGDIGIANDNSDNSYHVVTFDGVSSGTITNATLLTGITIQNGNANGASYPDNSGGGILCLGNQVGNACSPTLVNTIFANNHASDRGGAIFFNADSQGNSEPVIVSSLFVTNHAEKGGAIFNNGENSGNSAPSIVNVTFFGNTATQSGGAIQNNAISGTSSPTIANSVFWSNSSNISNIGPGAQSQISYSLLENQFPSGIGNIDATVQGFDPLFSDLTEPSGADGFLGTGDDGIRPQLDSPLLNTGNNSAIPIDINDSNLNGNTTEQISTDVIFQSRIQEVTVNIGAYEGISNPLQPIYVNHAATGNSSGTSWENAYTSLSAALNVATGNNQIWVASGTYKPGNNRSDSFVIEGTQNGLRLFGGFAGTEESPAERSPQNLQTILSGDIGIEGNKNDNSYHVVVFDSDRHYPITSATWLDGFVITGGNANGAQLHQQAGGGIYCIADQGESRTCSPTLNRLFIVGNSAVNGGGIYIAGRGLGTVSPHIRNTVIFQNVAYFQGGGIYNDAAAGGYSRTTLTNVTIVGNSAFGNASGTPFGRGAAIYNTAGPTQGNSNLIANNTIIWGNHGLTQIENVQASQTFTYSAAQGINLQGEGNLSSGSDGFHPHFVNQFFGAGPDGLWGTADDGLRLSSISPLINAGTAENNDLLSPIDVSGNPRVERSRADIGAYESLFDTVVPNIGRNKNYSIALSGTGSSISLSDAGGAFGDIEPNSDATFEFWFKPNFAEMSTSEKASLLNVRSAFVDDLILIQLGTDDDQDQTIRVSVADVASTELVGLATASNVWYHVTYVVESGVGTLFINGESYGTHASDIDLRQVTDVQYGVLVENGTSGQHFAGNMDEIRIWGIARLQEDIRSNRLQVLSGRESDLLVYLPMIEGEGTVSSEATNTGRTAALVNATWSEETFFTETVVNSSSLSLNGLTQGVSIASIRDEMAQRTPFTIEFWIKPTVEPNTTGNPEHLISVTRGQAQQFRIYLASQQNGSFRRLMLRGFMADPTNKFFTLEGPLVLENQWTHVAFTNQAGIGRLYVNGKYYAQTETTLPFSNTETWLLGEGRFVTSVSNRYSGQFDEVRFWSTARSLAQIQESLYQPLKGDEPNLMAYWPMNNSLQDYSGNDRHAVGINSVSFRNETHPTGAVINGTEGWRLLSNPTSNASFGTILDRVWTQGFPGATMPNFGSPNVLVWDSAQQQFEAVVNADQVPAPGTGFIAYMYSDDDFDGVPDGFPKTIQVPNSPIDGRVKPNLLYTSTGEPENDGWNLVGNPYSSTILWEAPLGWNRSNLSSSFYVWDIVTSTYRSWNGISGTLPNGNIAPWQGFWVQATGNNPDLEYNDAVRDAGGILMRERAVSQIQLTLEGQDQHSATTIMFHEDAEVGFDHLDAWKLESLNGNPFMLYAVSNDGKALDINALPDDRAVTHEIPLGLAGISADSEITLHWEMEEVLQHWNAELVDLHDESTTPMNETGKFTFWMGVAKSMPTDSLDTYVASADEPTGPSLHRTVSPDIVRQKSASSERFVLRLSPTNGLDETSESMLPTEVALRQNYPNPFNPTTTIQFELPSETSVRLQVFDVTGRLVTTLVDGSMSAGVHRAVLNGTQLASGIYLYRLETGTSTITKKLVLIK